MKMVQDYFSLCCGQDSDNLKSYGTSYILNYIFYLDAKKSWWSIDQVTEWLRWEVVIAPARFSFAWHREEIIVQKKEKLNKKGLLENRGI